MTEAADKTTSLWKDSYLAYIPLLGAAVAVTFDVGYFFALNWSFFTLFSLSEHILFAIQAFPIALVIVLLSFGAVGIILNAPSRTSPAAPVNPQTLHGIKLIAAYVILVLLVLALLSLVGYLLYSIISSTPIVTPLLMETFIVLGGFVFIPDPYKRTFIAAAAVVFVLTFSFFVVYLFSASAITSAEPNNLFQLGVGTINLKNGASIDGRIIRSGERGVLIYDQVSDRLRFLLWEGITSIEALPRPSTARQAP